MENSFKFVHREGSFFWEDKYTRVEFISQSAENSGAVKIWQESIKGHGKNWSFYWKLTAEYWMKNTDTLRAFLKELQYIYDCKPNKEWTPIRREVDYKLWGHRLTRKTAGASEVYEISKRARVGCEYYDLFVGRKAGNAAPFGVTMEYLKREEVAQLILCLKEYLGED